VQTGSGARGWVGATIGFAVVAVSPSGTSVTVVSASAISVTAVSPSGVSVGPASVPGVVGEDWGVKVGRKGVRVEPRAILCVGGGGPPSVSS
jgi:hypothetical protein